MKIEHKIACFFALFGTVYFLESIGGFYMTSAIVYIEKQFKIPSRLSGTMVSASDFAYIPVVVFTSYFGGQGNRARWIGGGCLLIAVADMLISSSSFLFPRVDDHLNSSSIPKALVYEVDR
ncbi:MFS domain-containing protein [Trichostrongylus colubriformis]|uniref:MFS domain-containing protein n=1 Tax=Trichostrongylus colubriformis TaxID=6319 RepID=A0AAN8EV87_TRICO